MKIVHISTNDIAGGAARSAYRLHQGLRDLGCDTTMFVKSSKSNDKDVFQLEPSTDIASRLLRRVRRDNINNENKKYRKTTPVGYEGFSGCRSPIWNDFMKQMPKCDIVNIHWAADMFLDYEKFFKYMPRDVKVVWTLHDMNPITGGCHYNMGCEWYKTECGACPQLGSNKPDDLSKKNWQRKVKAFERAPNTLHFVAPCQWLANEIEMSPLTKEFSVSVIPYGINLEDFSPRDQSVCKEILGVSAGFKVVLFVAEGLDNSRKGFSILLKALEKAVEKVPVVLVSVGGNKPNFQIDTKWIHIGSIANDRLLSMIYSAADLFVIPSIQDNLPNTVIEALACGTPVLGFDIGGIPDMVKSGINGLLAPAGDSDALSSAMIELLSSPHELNSMRLNARSIAVEEYPQELQANRYLSLYSELLNSNH